MTDDRSDRRQAALRAVMTAGEQLDDVKRARMWAKLEPQLAVASPVFRRWPWVAGGLTMVAAAIAVIVLHHDDVRPVLLAAEQTTLTAMAGPYARVALIGPARVELVDQGEATTLHVRNGTLLVTFEGGVGRSLRVEAPALTVDVIGTLFAVEVTGETSCVSVAHGRVRVTTADDHGTVGGGERWCSGDHQPRAIEPHVREALMRHEGQVAGASAPTPIAAPPDIAPRSQSPADPAVKPRVVAKPSPPEPIAKASPPIATPSPAEPIAEPPPPAAPVEPKPAAPVEPKPATATAEELYHSAEALLAHGDAAGADRVLAKLITDYPTAAAIDQALYDRARIAFARAAWSDARASLDQLLALPNSPLAEPARYLACRIAHTAHDANVTRCFTDYRAAYPHSPHDLDVLGLLIELGYADGGCAAVRSQLATLVARYPSGPATQAWQARCPAGHR